MKEANTDSPRVLLNQNGAVNAEGSLLLIQPNRVPFSSLPALATLPSHLLKQHTAANYTVHSISIYWKTEVPSSFLIAYMHTSFQTQEWWFRDSNIIDCELERGIQILL